MDFFEAVEKRRSVREFKEKEVEEEKLQKILETVNLAPSAGDLQAYEVVVIKSAEKRKELAEAAFNQLKNSKTEPISLVFFANPERSAQRYGERGEKLYAVQDATIAAAYSQLAATALGLGSVWIGAFDPEAVKKVCKASEGLEPVAIIQIGYPAEKPERAPRRELKDLVKRKEFK